MLPLLPQHGPAGAWDEIIPIALAVLLTVAIAGVGLWARGLRAEREEPPGESRHE
jgi:hypothetical protein